MKYYHFIKKLEIVVENTHFQDFWGVEISQFGKFLTKQFSMIELGNGFELGQPCKN